MSDARKKFLSKKNKRLRRLTSKFQKNQSTKQNSKDYENTKKIIENDYNDDKKKISEWQTAVSKGTTNNRCVVLFNWAIGASCIVLAILLVITQVQNSALQSQNDQLHGDVESLIRCRATEAHNSWFASEWFPSTVLCDGADCLSKSAPETTLEGCVEKTHELIKTEIERRKAKNTIEGDSKDIEILFKYKKHLAGLMMLWHLTTMETNNNVKLRF